MRSFFRNLAIMLAALVAIVVAPLAVAQDAASPASAVAAGRLDAAIAAARKAHSEGGDVAGPARIIADLSTHASGKADRVVLGRWVEGGGYVAEAKINGGIWFEMPAATFEHLIADLPSDQARELTWSVNRQFLLTQLEKGVRRIELFGETIEQVLLNRPNSFTALELKFLAENAERFGYGRAGNSWVKAR